MKHITVLLTSLLFFFMASLAIAGQSQDELKLGVVPVKSAKGVVETYFPLAVWLSKELGINIRVVSAGGIDQYLERIYSRQYDIIVLGSTFYFKAHDKAGYQVLTRGYPPFHSGIIVLKESGIDSLEQLRGKSMAAINRQGRGGYKLQKMGLADAGINMDTDLDVHFRGNFGSVIYSVLSGNDTAGAIRLDSLQAADIEKVRHKLKVIYTSPENPQHPFAVRSDMDPALREKIKNLLLSMNMENPETAALLTGLQCTGMEEINQDDMDQLQLFRKKKRESGMKAFQK